MEQTPKYGLKKPGGSDYGDVAVLNENADKIDTALDGLEKGKAPKSHTHTAGETGADPAGSAAAALEAAKLDATAKANEAEQNAKDASEKAGATAAHNVNATAHMDIRSALSAAQQLAQEAKSLAEGRSRAVSYTGYSSMVAAVNIMSKTAMRVGDNLLLEALGVPDLWVSKVESTAVIYTYTTDAALEDALGLEPVQMGYYKLSMLETPKVDLRGYVPAIRTINGKQLTGNITLTAGDVSARAATWVPSWGEVTGKPGTFAPSAHTHTPDQAGVGKTLTFTGAASGTYDGTGDVSINIPEGSSGAYGVCATPAATTSKTVAASNFTLVRGARVAVTFTYGVPTNATLNVNSTGAKNIRWQGSNIFGGIIGAGDTAEFVFTGSYWYIIAVDKVAAGAINFSEAGWDTINAIASAGLARSFWTAGDTKQVILTTGESIVVRIEDFGHDDLASGGKAPITIGMPNCLKTTMAMNSRTSTNAGGWGSSPMRTWMSTLLSQLPSDLQAVIKQASKKTSAGSQSSTISTTADKLWLFSYTEVGLPNASSYSPGNSSEGVAYPLFVADASRVKNVNGSAAPWWLRSPCLGDAASFCSVYSDGTRNYSNASSTYGVAVGFCI